MVVCPNCNNENENTNKFCYVCGYDLSEELIKVKDEQIIQEKKSKEEADKHNENVEILKQQTIEKEKQLRDKKEIDAKRSVLEKEAEKVSKKQMMIDQQDAFKGNNLNFDKKIYKLNKLRMKLFYRKNNDSEIVLSKTKVISIIGVIVWFIYGFTVQSISGILFEKTALVLVIDIIIALIVFIVLYCIGNVFRFIKSKIKK